MRARAPSTRLAVFLISTMAVSCGDDAECSGAAFTGAAVTCGMTGTFDRTVCVDGKLRMFREYVPEAVTCDAPPPLLVFLHGNGGNETSGDVARQVADELGVVYVSPRGFAQDGFLGFGPEGIENSRSFLTMVVDQVKKEFPTDPQFTVLTGFSGGGFFSAYCIAWLNDRLAGVGIFGAGIAEDWSAQFTAAPVKLPVFIRMGNQDSLQRYASLLALELSAAGWPPDRLDSQLFEGGHKWSPDMIRETFAFARSQPTRP